MMDICPDRALIGFTFAGALGHFGQALDSESVNSFVEVSIGFDQGLLGVHHSHPGHLAELLDVLGGYLSHW